MAVYPAYRRVETWLHGRAGLASSAFTLLMLAALVVSVMLCGGAAGTWPREPLSVAIIVLMTLTLLASTIALASGCSTLLHAAAHMVLFGAFLFLVVVP